MLAEREILMRIIASIRKRPIWPKLGIYIPIITYDVYEESIDKRTLKKLNDKSFKLKIAAKAFVAKVNRQNFVEKLRGQIMVNEHLQVEETVKYRNVDKDLIDWTYSEQGWNPVTGCTKISDGCSHCYSLDRIFPWKHQMGNPGYEDGAIVTCFEDRLDKPRHWRKPRRVFVASLGDLFHEDVPDEFIGKVFDVMNECPQHIFMICTKRPKRMVQMVETLNFTSNIWMGVTVENDKYTNRIDELRKVPSTVRFVYTEPLLGPINNMNLNGIHIVLCGGESGPGFRTMEADWARIIRDQCVAADVAFYFKQWAGYRTHSGGRELDGVTWNQYPLAPGMTLINKEDSNE